MRITHGGTRVLLVLSLAVGVLTLMIRPWPGVPGGGDPGDPVELGDPVLPPRAQPVPPAPDSGPISAPGNDPRSDPGSAPGTAPARPTASWSVHGPLLTWHTTRTTSATASVHGEQGQRHGCLSIGTHPALWPHGTTWDEATSTLTLPDGTRAPIGTALRGVSEPGSDGDLQPTPPRG